jgi:phosphate transport system protein
MVAVQTPAVAHPALSFPGQYGDIVARAERIVTVATDDGSYQRELQRVDAVVARLFALVCEGTAGAAEAFLGSDDEAAAAIHAQDPVVDGLYREVEQLVQEILTQRSPDAAELRFLLTVIRIVPELERSADLTDHIARRGGQHLAVELTPRARGLIQQMASQGTGMWRRVTEAYIDRDPAAAAELDDDDNELDELHGGLLLELASSGLRSSVLLEMALVARFFERIGDHAVNIARRIAYLAAA